MSKDWSLSYLCPGNGVSSGLICGCLALCDGGDVAAPVINAKRSGCTPVLACSEACILGSASGTLVNGVNGVCCRDGSANSACCLGRQ
jgi:hypothetical protein